MDTVAGGAKGAGEMLLGEVEVESLSSLLSSLRELTHTDTQRKYFGIRELDDLFPYSSPPAPGPIQQPPQQHQGSDDIRNPNALGIDPVHLHLNLSKETRRQKTVAPIIELISPPSTHHVSGSGKTSLVYLITALAILPPSISSISLGGNNAAVILFDPLNHFSVRRLAEIMISFIHQRVKEAGKQDEELEGLREDIASMVKRALMHVHIFRPQSWDSLLATLQSLPEYLFSPAQHKSINRRIHSLVLEDVDAFVYQIRSTFATTMTNADKHANPLAAASSELGSHLTQFSTLFSSAIILTSHSTSPSVFRPPLPTSWPQNTPVTRLAVKRAEVLPFAPGISIEEAEVERAQRWEVVQRGKTECGRVGTGVSGGGGHKEWEGFVFRVREGIQIEKEEG